MSLTSRLLSDVDFVAFDLETTGLYLSSQSVAGHLSFVLLVV